MSDSNTSIDIGRWIRAAATSVTRRQREVTQIILHAISATPALRDALCLKGGVLMGLVYGSTRLSADVDFSITDRSKPGKTIEQDYREMFDPALQRAAAECGYPDIALQVQGVRGLPENRFPDVEFPGVKVRIGYAVTGSQQHERLLEGQSSSVVELDISFNEAIGEIQVLRISEEKTLLAYSLIDMIAEKYRALLQQKDRNRYRRQDIYDLDILIGDAELDDAAREQVLETLMRKCESRIPAPGSGAMDDPEIRMRAQADWDTLEVEVRELPGFGECFERVREFYRKLPWHDK